MNKLKLILLAIVFFTITSCCNEETNQHVCNQVTETILFDSQDNMIRLNGVWVRNINEDVTPYERINWIGFDNSVDNSIKITSSKKIIKVENPSFNYTYGVTFFSPYEVVFNSNNLVQYYNSTDVYYFEITYLNE